MFEVTSGKIEVAQKVVIYGPEGVGKSSLAANFPNPIFIDTEGSTSQLEVDRLPKPSSWTMLQQQVSWVKAQGGRYKTLIIDTIDWAERLCNESVCSIHGVKGIEDFGYGKGYIYSEEEIGRFLNLLTDVIESGINVVLTAHSQIVKFEQPDEMGAYDRYQLKLGKGTGSRTAALVKEWADMILFVNYKTYSVAADEKGKKHKAQGGMRTVFATHHPAWDAKNRHGLPDEFPLDYGQIAHIFNSQAINQVQQTWTSQPTPQQQVEQAPPVQQPEPQQQATQPEVQPQQAAPMTPPVEQQPTQASGLDPSIPQALRDLMQQNNVSAEEIDIVVSKKGYFPLGTPIANYPQEFIDGVLVAAWPQVFGMVQEFRNSLPFD